MFRCVTFTWYFQQRLKDLGPAPPVSKEEGEAERFPTGFTEEAQIY